MNDLNTGVAATPAAGGQQGTGEGQQQPAGAAQAPAQQPAQQTGGGGPGAAQVKEITVPLHVVEAVRKELTETKAGKAGLEARLSQLEAMQSMGGMVQQPLPSPANVPGQQAQGVDPFKEAGLEDDDLVDAATLRKIVATLRPGAGQDNTEPLRADIAKLQLQITDPKYEQTIRTYLPEMITANPMLRELITRSPNPLMSALTMAHMSPRYIQEKQQAKEQANAGPAPPPDPLAELQRIIENATKPGSPASMGGGGAVSGYDRFRTMGDAEFDEEVQRVLGGVIG